MYDVEFQTVMFATPRCRFDCFFRRLIDGTFRREVSGRTVPGGRLARTRVRYTARVGPKWADVSLLSAAAELETEARPGKPVGNGIGNNVVHCKWRTRRETECATGFQTIEKTPTFSRSTWCARMYYTRSYGRVVGRAGRI